MYNLDVKNLISKYEMNWRERKKAFYFKLILLNYVIN